MSELLGYFFLTLSAAALLFGVLIEHQQRSETGPVAIVPTLPHAVASGLCAAIGVAALCIARNRSAAWWLPPVAFVLVLMLGTWLIIAVGARAERRRQR